MSTDFDALTIDQLRRGGSLKWTLFPDTIGAFVAEMDFGTAPVVTEALQTAVADGVLGYLPPGLAAELAGATASWCAESYGWPVAAEQVHPIADVLTGLEIVLRNYARPGAPIILPTPAYMPFLEVPRQLGWDIIEVPLLTRDGRCELDLDGIDAAYRAGGHLLVLTNPHNPVGTVFTPAELVAVSEVVSRHGGRVFADEIHAPLVFPGSRHVPYASLGDTMAAHSVTATSASKAFNLPGLKCAQLILTNDADAATWERIGFTASLGTSTLGVLASTAAYTAGRPWLDGVLGYLDGNRRRLAELVEEHLPSVGYRLPDGTYIGWLDCRGLDLAEAPADFFRRHAGVALTDGAACGEAGRGFVRLVFATPRPILEQAVRQLGQAVRQLGQAVRAG